MVCYTKASGTMVHVGYRPGFWGMLALVTAQPPWGDLGIRSAEHAGKGGGIEIIPPGSDLAALDLEGTAYRQGDGLAIRHLEMIHALGEDPIVIGQQRKDLEADLLDDAQEAQKTSISPWPRKGAMGMLW